MKGSPALWAGDLSKEGLEGKAPNLALPIWLCQFGA